MRDFETKHLLLIVGGVGLLGALVLGVINWVGVREARAVLEVAETELADVSTGMFGGYLFPKEGAEWSDPVVGMQDEVTIGDETRTVEDWLAEAGEAYHDARSQADSRHDWKAELMATRARRIYACLNAHAALERAEQNQAASSLNVFGGFSDRSGRGGWVGAGLALDDRVAVDGELQRVERWLWYAGGSISVAYELEKRGLCRAAQVKADEAAHVYHALNERAGRDVGFWNLNPLAMKE